MFPSKLTTLFTFILCVGSALTHPIVLEERAAKAELVLRETNTNSAKWHFALVVRAPGTTGKMLAIEHAVDYKEKCLAFDDTKEREVNEGNVVISVDLIAKGGESDDVELAVAVAEIAEEVPSATKADVNSGTFRNCFDFVAEAVDKIKKKGYLSAADAKKFTDYHAAHAAAVKQYTDAVTMKACARDGTGCKPKSSKPAAKEAAGKKPGKD
ncbi:hypothetical protein BT96DRAFT_921254 [Gymnopus androsaceus JB14]|uniref:Uncharacterized protein n=1 Tax=Gymnopus androsaceus JB14 TaxID=1447944 RepID=A0A6A4HL64_9AGAR|nr:hypothetical protein BT96DRAFT_921254 [Gymnopus androsaceus JB14]